MQVYIQCKGVQMQSKIKVFLITNKCRYIFNVKVYKFITENKHSFKITQCMYEHCWLRLWIYSFCMVNPSVWSEILSSRQPALDISVNISSDRSTFPS